jgi:CheY-like chemotaxis protein
MVEDRAKCLAVGCDAFEGKPVNFDRLRATMQHLLSHDQSATGPAASDG